MRRAGILMPITALPSPYGVGTMGQCAREFVDFLVAAGQSDWQVLPISPTGYGDSPYQSFSSFAGNPYFIDLDDLARDGLLEKEEYCSIHWGDDPERVDYGLIYRKRFPVLRQAVTRLVERKDPAFSAFCREEAEWLGDYARFMAFKDHFDGVAWSQWPEPLRRRHPHAMEEMEEKLAEEITFWQGVQYLFFSQWRALKEYANGRNISIIGDLPIYVSGDSADVWANPSQFQLDEDLNPTEVAGCPPDGFSVEGQLWGNPLFDWDSMAQHGYDWWVKRIAFQFEIYDVLRIDHFRGFDAYYAIPAGAKDARKGRWRQGPGISFFRTVEQALGPRPIIAEDLGFLTPSVHQLLQDTGFPGMKVLEFAFDSRDGGGSDYLPHNFPRNCVAYVGTHDNETVQGWLAAASPDDVEMAREYLHMDAQEGEHWGMMRGIWSSVAHWAIVQMQDLLGLDSRARMNTPATLGDNWVWRALPGFDDSALARKVLRQMQLYGRSPWPKSQKTEQKE